MVLEILLIFSSSMLLIKNMTVLFLKKYEIFQNEKLKILYPFILSIRDVIFLAFLKHLLFLTLYRALSCFLAFSPMHR